MPKTKLERLAYREGELVDMLGLGESTVASLIADGTIPSVKIRGSRLVSADVLDSLLTPGGDDSQVSA